MLTVEIWFTDLEAIMGQSMSAPSIPQGISLLQGAQTRPFTLEIFKNERKAQRIIN
jgi:hypothetical protein